MEVEAEELVRGAQDFILPRRKESGGFGATPALPPTVEDTYFALAALRVCGALKSDPSTLRFLQGLNFYRMSPEVRVRWLKGLLWLGGASPKEVKFLLQEELNHPPERLSGLAALREMADLLGVDSAGVRRLKELGRTRSFRTLKDLYHLFKALGPGEWSNGVEEFILHSQNPDGGFGFFPGTTSYLENTYFACRLMKALGLKPRDPEGLRLFVLNTRRKDGGFARAPRGVSFLETTYYALWILLRFF